MYNTLNSVIRHLYRHLSGNYQCNKCPESFHFKSELESHKNKHSDCRFQCNKRDKSAEQNHCNIYIYLLLKILFLCIISQYVSNYLEDNPPLILSTNTSSVCMYVCLSVCLLLSHLSLNPTQRNERF